MGLLSTFRSWITPLSNTDRQQIWKMFGSFKANSFSLNDTDLIENSYERNVDVYGVIKKIVDVCKSLNWVIEEKKGDEWVEITDSTLTDLINSPNASKKYTWNDIEEQLLIYILTTGNAYLYGETQFNNTLIEEVDVLPSNHVCIKSNNDFFIPIVSYNLEINNKKYNIDSARVAHMKLFNAGYNTVNESLYGLSPIQVAAKVVQTSNDRWDADANLLQNRGAIGLITDKSNRPMLPEEAAKVQSDFDYQTGGTRNFGKIKVTNKDLGYIQMAMSSVDLQLIEKGVVNLRAICNVFGLDSSLFNDPENKTYNNRLEAEKSMYTNAIMPISDRMAESLTFFLCKNHFPNRNVRMRQDFSKVEVLQKNKKEEAEKDKIVVDGINVIMNMPVSKETKALLLRETYGVDDETIDVFIATDANGGSSIDSLGKIPLALQQLALARERSNTAGDTGLSDSLSQAMDILTRELVTTVIQ